MSRSLVRFAFPFLVLYPLACAAPDDPAPADPEPDEGAEVLAEGTSVLARPAGVGNDFVPTPNGWFHRSCVIRLRAGEAVKDDHIEGPDGSRAILPCDYAAFDHSGRRRDRGTPPPTVNGWLASLNSSSAGALNYLTAKWTVPQRPTARQGQTLYFFPGLEPLTTADTILQPVLAWNGFAEGSWTISSWNCCRDGNVFHSTPIKVSPGHSLLGTVTGTSCNSSGVCSTWKVVTKDVSLDKSTSFPTTAYGEKLDWVFGGALEAYGLDLCSEQSASTSVRFTEIKAHDFHGHSVLPSWAHFRASGVSPDCHAHFGTPSISGTTSAVSLYWRNTN